MKKFLSFFKRASKIPLIKLNGDVNIDLVDKIKGKRFPAIAVVIDSRGGLPGQAEIICDKLNILKKKFNVPLLLFTEDLAVSAGYFILCIGDKIYADQSSLVGSIGVITTNISFKKLIEKHKIERRKITSNENSYYNQMDWLDDFEKQKNSPFLKEVMKDFHTKFIDHVKEYRYKEFQDKIKKTDEEINEIIFNGNVWVGKEAIDFGLIDDFGDYQTVLKEKYPKSKIVDYTYKTPKEKIDEITKAYSNVFTSSFWIKSMIDKLTKN